MKNNWYEINAKENAIHEVLIYGDIADYDVSAMQFRSDLYAIDSPEIDLRISSRGGDFFAGVAIYNAIKEHPAKITAYIDSLAASISAFIPMAANHRIMAPNARLMIHKAWGMVAGNADELQAVIARLNDVDTIQVAEFAEKSGKTSAEVLELLAAETWLTPEQAKELGLVDEISGDGTTKAQFDLSPFAKVPADIAAMYGKNGNTDRDIEQLLRDAGVSKKAAMTAVAAIKGETRRDSDDANESANNLMAKFETEILTAKFKGA